MNKASTFFNLSRRVTMLLLLALFASVSAWAEDVSYIERSWDGTKVVSVNKMVSATFITGDWESKGSETMTLENGKWYYIPSKAYNGGKPVERKRLIIPYDAGGDKGAIHIILGDGAELRSVITFQGYKYYGDVIDHGTLHIHAQSDGENMGKIIANASGSGEAIRTLTDCAGIGGTDESGSDFSSGNRKSNSCGTLYIHGGDIYAKGNTLAAGIGGGDDGNGGEIYIYGGKVKAYGGDDAAGIGGGEDGNGGKLYVYGGEVFADGTDWAAGIGGGEDGSGAEVHLLGGSVTAWAGEDAGEDGGLAFGGGDTDESRGSLEIGDLMTVYAGQNASDANSHRFSEKERKAACWYRPYAKVVSCDHGGSPSYVINGDGTSGTHSLTCKYCKGYSNKKHTFGADGKCTICGAGNVTYTINMYVPHMTDLPGVADGYVSEPLTATVAQGNTFILPTPSNEYLPVNTVFVGWARTGIAVGESYLHNGENLLPAGTTLTFNNGNNLTFKAKYKENTIDLNVETMSNQQIQELLDENDGKQVPRITFLGLTLHKDGKWNTICLPFDYEYNKNDDANPLKGDNVDVRMLKSSSWDSEKEVLTLNFTDKNEDAAGNTLTKLEAGKPYLIRWNDTGEDLYSPSFYNVTISTNKKNTTNEFVSFVGIFSSRQLREAGGYNTDLYLHTDDKLYYAAETHTVTPFHAYISLNGGLYVNTTGVHMFSEKPKGLGDIIFKFGNTKERAIGWAVADVALLDTGDNNEALTQYAGWRVNVNYDRVLSATDKGDGTWASRAYTVCLPYAFDLTAQQEAGQVNVYQPQLIKDNKQILFTNASPKLEAGSAYVVVVNNGTLSLNTKNVELIEQPKSGMPIYDYAGGSKLLGFWKGSFVKVENADCAAMFAYGFQKDGYLKRYRLEYPNSWWGAFRAMFCAAAPAGQDLTVSPLGTNVLTPAFQQWLNGEEDESNPITDFPADSFEGDCDIPDEGTGIKNVIREEGKGQYFDLQGRPVLNPAKGVYIHNGKKLIVK